MHSTHLRSRSYDPLPWWKSICINYLKLYLRDFSILVHLFIWVWIHGYLFYSYGIYINVWISSYWSDTYNLYFSIFIFLNSSKHRFVKYIMSSIYNHHKYTFWNFVFSLSCRLNVAFHLIFIHLCEMVALNPLYSWTLNFLYPYL